MKAQSIDLPNVFRHRANLKRLVDRLEKKPFDYLPERSVQCLDRFFSGYSFFGPPIDRDLTSFSFWLKKRLFYPDDTGACLPRFIQLNSKDRCDSFEMFCRLYRQYCKQKPTDLWPNAPEVIFRADSFDFYEHLYVISKRPGMYIGSDDVQLLAAYLAGYFAGKKHSGIALTRDEREFQRFGKWLSGRHKLPREYPWYRLVEMWQGPYNSCQNFFVDYDAFQTNYGKRVGGLDDLFESVSDGKHTVDRRRQKMPKKVIRIPGSQMWWRSPANRNVVPLT